MKQQISSEEQAWRQSATNHEFPLQNGDWSAMERLIDRQDNPAAEGLAGSPDSGLSLGNRWPFPFFAGVLISLLVMAGQAWSGQESAPEPASPIVTQQPLIAENTDGSLPKAEHASALASSPAETTIPSSEGSEKRPVTNIPPRSIHTPNTPLPPSSSSTQYVQDVNPSQQVSLLESATTAPRKDQRPAVSDFNTLTEEEYTPGLMAFSRLTGKVGVGAPIESPDLPAPAPYLLPTPVRWSFGILAGGRMALPDWPIETASFGGVAGGFVQYDLTPHWSIRTELAGKLLDRDLQRTDSEVLLDEFGATLKVDQSAHTNGLLFVEMPVLAVLRQGRHEWFAGPKLALVRVRNDASSLAYSGNAFTEVKEYDITEGVRRLDVGLTFGYGYRLFHHWGVDLRYNQGLLDLTHDNFFNNSHTLINSDLQLTFRYVF